MAEGGNDLENIFEKAADYAKNNMGSFETDQILQLYGLFKQATVGKNTTSKPNFWNMVAKQKWEAWNQHGEKSKPNAMQEYVALVTSVNPDWLTEKTHSWVVHSTLRNENDDVPESEQDIFYWVKENNQAFLKKAIIGADVAVTDVEGLSLLHWAADRGHVGVIRLLLDSGADPNVQDPEGQTPLHYAAACGHGEAVASLLQGGASILIADGEGNKPKDVAASEEIAQIIDSGYAD